MKRQRAWIITSVCTIALLPSGVGVKAQATQEEKNQKKDKPRVIVEEERIIPLKLSLDGPGHGDLMTFVSSEMSFDLKVVKGAPYSAQAVTEHQQILNDGNRITRKGASSVYRDGEGRTRREQALAAIGPSSAGGDQPQAIFINDPLAGVNYILDPRTHTARKMEFKSGVMALSGKAEGGQRRTVEIHRGVEEHSRKAEDLHHGVEVRTMVNDGFVSTQALKVKLSEPKTESLGKQNIEGVEVEGTRTTVTIPAGSVGNERPIEIVSEQWYSPALQTVVMSKHSDPRVGENLFRLTNINLGEPARSLFELPADYTVTDQPAVKDFRIKKEKSGEDY